MSGEAAVFWVFATLTVASAAVVVLSRTLIYSAFALLVTFFGVAGLYVLINFLVDLLYAVVDPRVRL